MDDLNFTEEEIREQLEKLGYLDVPTSRLAEFKRDLERLVAHERSKNSSWSTCSESTSSESHAVYGRARHDGQENHMKYTHQPMGERACYRKENIIYDQDGHQSVMTKTRVPNPDMRNFSMYSNNNDDKQDPDQTDPNDTIDSTSTTERKMIKRRVLRKRDGHTEITDELTESEADDLSCIGDRLEGLQLDHIHERGGKVGSNHPSHFDPYRHYQTGERPVTAPSDRIKNRFGLPENYAGPTALIRPMSGEPHTKNIRKADPVSRYQKYRQSWQAQNAPGEKNHKNLRWNVREQMLYHDQVVQKKPHKVYIPNTYIIPSDKKRKSLRWNVRQDLAQGLIPPSVYE